MRRRPRREPVRARLQSRDEPGRLDVIVEPGLAQFSVEQIDVVLRELLKVREIVC
jgi:hypothetical protein